MYFFFLSICLLEKRVFVIVSVCLSEVCFVDDPNERADFTHVVGLLTKELSNEEIARYAEMNKKYQSVYANNYLKVGQR